MTITNTPRGNHTRKEINIVLDFPLNLNPIIKLIQTVAGVNLI